MLQSKNLNVENAMFTQRSWSHIYFGKFLHFCGRGNELREPLFVKYGNARNCVSNFNYSAKSLLSWAFHNGGCCHPLIDSRFLVLSRAWQIHFPLLLRGHWSLSSTRSLDQPIGIYEISLQWSSKLFLWSWTLKLSIV